MPQISKELFCLTMENLKRQIVYDKVNQEFLSESFGKELEIVSIADNSIIMNNLILLLQEFFPRDENGFCEIEHYINFTNFGKPSLDSEYFSPEELYDKLIKSWQKHHLT
jgi:hypothetical protein